MLKLFWADIRQLKKPFLFLLLAIPLLHYLDANYFGFALPHKVPIEIESKIYWANQPFSSYSGWPFALIASIILMLFSEEAGGGLQGRLASLASLPLKRWQIGLLRHLPALTVVLALGMILNLYRFCLAYFFAITRSDSWQLSHSIDLQTATNAFWWSFDKLTNMYGPGHASFLFQLAGWISMGLLTFGIPLLIDDLWPNIKRSSFSLWLSVSLVTGIALQVAVFGFGQYYNLELFPHFSGIPDMDPSYSTSYFTVMTIELMLAFSVMALELWRFQRRASYV